MPVSFVDFDPGDPRLTSDVLPVLMQLRPHLTAAMFDAVYREGYPQGLRFTALYDERADCVSVAGWRLMATTATERKLYVDDLVTAAQARHGGFGRALLQELESRARRHGCQAIDLDSGVHRTEAHRFYMRERLSITSFHFARSLASPHDAGAG